MNATPIWSDKAVINAVWVATNETPEWIIERVDSLLDSLSAIFTINDWRASSDVAWQGTSEEKAAIVRGYTTTDPFGEPEPGDGYTFTVSGAGSRTQLHVRVSAGADTLGRRTPHHSLNIILRGVDATAGDAAVAAVVESWQPAYVTLANTPLLAAARRGGWKVGYGYRTWISSALGAVQHPADGLIVAPLGNGTVISAPDDWAPEQVVAALTETFTASNLDEVPR